MSENKTSRMISVVLVLMMLVSGLSTLGTGTNNAMIEQADTIEFNTVNEEQPVPQTTGSKFDGILGEDHGEEMYPTYSKPDENHVSMANPYGLHGITDAHTLGYKGDDVNFAVVDTGVDFGHVDLMGTQATVTDTSSPYFGWPIAYDPHSMSTYIDSMDPAGTWYANTSRKGPGPFEFEHTINVDGDNDFSFPEKIGSSASAMKNDFQLYDSYITYDAENWYAGIYASPTDINITVGMLMDVDRTASGSVTVPDGNLIDTKTSHNNFVRDIAFTLDGTRAATASLDRTARIWDVATQELIWTLPHNTNVGSAIWSNDGNTLFTSDTEMIHAWNANTGAEIYSIAFSSLDGSLAFAISPNGTWLFAASSSDIHIYNVSNGEYQGLIWASGAAINSIEFSPIDDTVIATNIGKEMGILHLNSTNIISPTETKTRAVLQYFLKGHSQEIQDISWHSNGNILTAGGTDNTVKIWNSLDNQQISMEPSAMGPADTTTTVQSVNDLKNNDGATYEVKPGERMLVNKSDFKGAPVDGHISIVRISAKYVVDGSYDGNQGMRVSFYGTDADLNNTPFEFHQTSIKPLNGENTPQARESANVLGKPGVPEFVLFGDLKNMAIWFEHSGSSGTVRFDYVWMNVTYVPGATLHDHTSTVSSVDWSKDGDRFASGSEDKTVKIWSGTTNTVLNSIQYLYGINRVRWSPVNNDLLSYCSNDLSARLYNIVTESEHVFLVYKPDYAVYANLAIRFDPRSEIENATAPTIENVMFHEWTGSAWAPSKLTEIGGTWAFSVDPLGMAFIELAIPRKLLGDAKMMDVKFFTSGRNASHAHDSIPNDVNIPSSGIDWGNDVTSLSRFSPIKIKNYVVDSSIVALAKSTNFHFGFHPSPKMREFLGMGILVVETQTAGVYDGVYIDFNNDLRFDTTDVFVDRANPIAVYDSDGDGIPDLSAGMLYFISQAKEVYNEKPEMSSSLSVGTLANQNLVNHSVEVLIGGQDFIIEKNETDINPEISEDRTEVSLTFGNLIPGKPVHVFVDDAPYSGEYAVDTLTGLLRFSVPLPDDVSLTINYTRYARPYTIDLEAGVVNFVPSLTQSQADDLTVSYQYDGVPIPYSEHYAERTFKTNIIPTNGNLLCFMGEFDKDLADGNLFSSHGTQVASAIVGQGKGNPPVLGVAPNAKVITIGNFASKTSNVIDAWYFAVEGYDGIVGSGDEANIVVNSFNYPTIHEDGWDQYSRMADYLSMEYSGQHSLFVSSVGDMGFGYGSVSSPASGTSVLSVGNALNFVDSATTRTNTSFQKDGTGGMEGNGTEGARPHYGTVSAGSSRGPTAAGELKPEIVALGQGTVALPYPQQWTGLESITSNIWSGTEFSSAIVAGSAALIYQAYKGNPANNNSFPDVSTARTLIMSGADSTGADVLTQGAGFLNVMRSIDIARDNDGLMVSPPTWVPGGLGDSRYESFLKMLAPGQSDYTHFQISNHADAQKEAMLSPGTFIKTSEYAYAGETSTFQYKDMDSEQYTLFDKAIVLVVNETGVYVVDKDVEDQMLVGQATDTQHQAYPTGKKVMDMDPEKWLNADMLRVTAHADYETIVLGPNKVNHTYSLLLYDWHNAMGEYLSWLRNNKAPPIDAYGIEPTFWIPESPVPYYQAIGFIGPLKVTGKPECTFPTMNNPSLMTKDLTDLTSWPTISDRDKIYDMNMISAGGGGTNVMEARVSDPASKVHDGLVIWLKPPSSESEMGGANGLLWNISLELFEDNSWDWMTINGASGPTTVNIPVTGSTVNATISVPADAHMGSYEGAMYVHNDLTNVVSEHVFEYPMYFSDEELYNVTVYSVSEEIANVSIYNAYDDPVANSTPTAAQLSHGNITGTPEIWKNEFLSFEVVGELVHEAVGNGTENGPFWLDNGGITNCTVVYNNTIANMTLMEGNEYTLNSVTGELNLIPVPLIEISGEVMPGDNGSQYFLQNGKVHDMVLYWSEALDPADYWLLTEGESFDYTLNYITGEINLNGWTVGPGGTVTGYLVAFYNYSRIVYSRVREEFDWNDGRLQFNLTYGKTPDLDLYWYQTGDPAGSLFWLDSADPLYGWVLNETSGHLTLTGSDWGDGLGQWFGADERLLAFYNTTFVPLAAGERIYASYNSTDPTATPRLLEMDVDYTMDFVTGGITLMPDEALNTGEWLNATYDWYEPVHTATLSNQNIVSCTLYLNGTLFNDYTIDNANGIITFNTPLGPGDVVTADYTWYVPINMVFSHLLNGNVIDLTVYTNGVEFTGTYVVDMKNGTIAFDNQPLSPGDVVTVEYTWHVPAHIPKVKLANDNIKPGTAHIFINGLETTAFTMILDGGIIIFDSPLEPGSVVTATYGYYAHVLTVPILVNVGNPNSLDLTFGGGDPMYLYDPNEVRGGYLKNVHVEYGTLNNPNFGDWRYYYVNIPDQGRFNMGGQGMYTSVELNWLNKPTDNDVYIFSPKAADTASMSAGHRFGPYPLNNAGGSETATKPEFLTVTNGSRENVVLKLVPGLNVIAIRNVILDGSTPNCVLNGEVGYISIDKEQAKEITNKGFGSTSVSLYSSKILRGANVTVLGPASTNSTTENEVWQEKPSDMAAQDAALTWRDYVYTLRLSSFQVTYEVENAATFDVHIRGDDADDLDLGIFYDHNRNGVIDSEDLIGRDFADFIAYNSWNPTNTVPYAICADMDSDERVQIINPPDGQYIIAVYGWSVKTGGVEGEGSPAYFDMDVSMIVAGVAGYGLNGFPGEDESDDMSNFKNSTDISPFSRSTYEVTWDFPSSASDGEYGGVLYIGTYDAPDLLSALVLIVVDRQPPEIPESRLIPAPGSIISNSLPTVVVQVDDPTRGEIDTSSVEMYFDGVDVSNLCSVNAPLDDSGKRSIGTVIYTPSKELENGAHIVEVRVSDLAGNQATRIWGFEVDTMMPALTLHGPEGVIHTNDANFRLLGSTEPNSRVSIAGIQGIVRMYSDSTFAIDVVLTEGENVLSIRSRDLPGNVHEIRRTIVLDTQVPTFKRVVALDGSTTNKRMTGIYGEMSERGTLQINGISVPVNSDGTFRHEAIQLIEGTNQQVLTFTDLAGNVAYNYLNITLDTTAPILTLTDIKKTVYSETLNITGNTEADVASLTVNGKLVGVDANGDFQQTLRLSPGTNTIVVESKDRAGNSVQEMLTVNFATDTFGTNWGAIGLMVALLLVGLILGLFLAPMILGGKKEEVPEEDELPEGEELPDDDLEAIDGEEIPEGEEPVEGELPEGEELPDDDLEAIEGEEPAGDDLDDLGAIEGEELPEKGLEDTDAEPIPEEESMPEDMPDEELPVEEDPRVAKLREAYDSGKISKELYEKNLAKFQGQ